MSDNISLERALSESTEDNKEQSLESPKEDTSEKFKDNNEVATTGANAAVTENILDQNVDPQSKDATKDSNDKNPLIVNEEQNSEPNITSIEIPKTETQPLNTTATDNNQTSATTNSSLSMLAQYDSQESSSSSKSESSSDTESSSMEVDSADSESSITSDASEKSLSAIKKKIDEFQEGDEEDDDETGEKQSRVPIKAIGELGIEDLPPIEDLFITVPEKECNLLGKITSIVDQLGKILFWVYFNHRI